MFLKLQSFVIEGGGEFSEFSAFSAFSAFSEFSEFSDFEVALSEVEQELCGSLEAEQ